MGKILFFGGKGGVGKTSCSGAYALAKANSGKKVLLVSTDPAHSVSDLFEVKIGSSIVEIRPNLFASEINPEEESARYIESIRASIRKVYSVVIVEEISRQLDAAKVSPGSHESALFDKMVEIINETSEQYDYIIFDTAPTGHTVRLITLPSLLGSWIDTLLAKRRKTLRYKQMADGHTAPDGSDDILEILTRRKESLSKAKDILLDSGKIGFIFVLNAEKLAIDETIKATEILEKYSVPIEGYIVNRILPENQTDKFWQKKKDIERAHLSEIEEAFKGRWIYKIPLLVSDIDAAEVDTIAGYFESVQ